MSACALNLWVFRDTRRTVSGQELKKQLLREVEPLARTRSQESVLRALLRAGELECGVTDAGVCPAPFQIATDHVAEMLIGSELSFQPDTIVDSLDGSFVPEELSIAEPEGFSYYALHPMAYPDAVASSLPGSSRVAVVGIRSIGTTLSAIVSAALKAQGRRAGRITVRPQGHPYNRELKLSNYEEDFVRKALADDSEFLVVDEGPGLSGSSFLSVAEALAAAGVSKQKITLLCSHRPDLDSFRCNDGSRRAREFRWLPVDSKPRKPEVESFYIGGGHWRAHLMATEQQWPASWVNLERAKYCTAGTTNEPLLFKFVGLAHYGERIIQREALLAQEKFGPAPQPASDGFASYPWLRGRPMCAHDLNDSALSRLAEYCAFRERSFRTDLRYLEVLQSMAEFNQTQLQLDFPVSLRLERPVIADGRMQPHEWLLLPDGRMLKTDSGSHGDDHFFPGPTDIAWDLAGAIVEWQMDEAQAEAFLERYRQSSGDNPAARIADFVIAYSVFRTAYCLMAANALSGMEEEPRLTLAADQYRTNLAARREEMANTI
ncbi:MAG TPA: hypothetical protein VFY05_06995 [Candidatus Angelobacter sp.]|nr:hypothetical protein [Candidatus Angelobacter sp.]